MKRREFITLLGGAAVEVAAHRHVQNTGGSRMRPVAKYMAKSGAINRNHIKAASRNATMPAPINA
jgi:hypothetical protein